MSWVLTSFLSRRPVRSGNSRYTPAFFLASHGRLVNINLPAPTQPPVSTEQRRVRWLFLLFELDAPHSPFGLFWSGVQCHERLLQGTSPPPDFRHMTNCANLFYSPLRSLILALRDGQVSSHPLRLRCSLVFSSLHGLFPHLRPASNPVTVDGPVLAHIARLRWSVFTFVFF